jgi:hypothetical protein
LIPSGLAAVPLPVRVELVTMVNEGAVVCTVPSGNFNPPRVISIMPWTVRGEVGVNVPIPTLPNLSSMM